MLSPIFGDKLYLNLVYFFALDDSRFCFCLRFLPEFLFRKAINGFVCKIVSLLFVYRVDVSSVTNVCTVLFPKRIVRDWVACFFYKRKIRIAAICLGLQNALNISDNSSIYNYYGANRVIIVQFATIMLIRLATPQLTE